MARPQIVERVDRHLAPVAEEGLPRAARRTRRRGGSGFAVLVASRHGADRGDAGVDEHDFLAARGVGIEFLVPGMETILDPIDQVPRVEFRPMSNPLLPPKP